MTKTLYDAIGLRPDATAVQIEEACLRLGNQYKAEGGEKFAEVERAYEMLMDADCRAVYDRSIGITHGWKGIIADYGSRAVTHWKLLGSVGVAIIAIFLFVNHHIEKVAREELEARGISFNPDGFTKEARQHPENVKLFLRAGMSPSVLDGRGNSPLVAAAFFLNLESVRLLVEAGASVNAQCSEGTPLSAALSGASSIHSLYISGLAEKAAQMSFEQRIAAEKVANVSIAMPIVQYLLDHGADPFAKAVQDSISIYKLGFTNMGSGRDAVFQLIIAAIEQRGPMQKSRETPTTIPTVTAQSQIKPDCTVNGAGHVSCTFHNAGNADASACYLIRLVGNSRDTACYGSWMRSVPASTVQNPDRCEGQFEYIEGGPVCSGIVRAHDVRQITQPLVFRNLTSILPTVHEWCSRQWGLGDWRQGCELKIAYVGHTR
ncbi:MAG: hypothetical protein IT515_13985 [Burkholderiales bacterium]|nr:hypothetical protein [Burkholderiales bacterium]